MSERLFPKICIRRAVSSWSACRLLSESSERAKDTPTEFRYETGDAITVSSARITIARASARYALSGVQGIPRSKCTAARADGLVIKFERADVVEDIMPEARGPRIELMARHECAVPRAGSASTRAESVFFDEVFVATMSHLLCSLFPSYASIGMGSWSTSCWRKGLVRLAADSLTLEPWARSKKACRMLGCVLIFVTAFRGC